MSFGRTDTLSPARELSRGLAAHSRPLFLGELGASANASIAARARWTTLVRRSKENQLSAPDPPPPP